MTKTCGCSTPSCGCCDGIKKWTPESTVNRSGLSAIQYRVGTHGTFFETMKARLSTMIVDGVGADGQTIETFQPLTGLTTRDSSDPSIALLDGWATVGDVLTFYQDRIANEGYLQTATERRSILELARLAGYELRPGVASTVYLAYTLEDTQVDPVEIPVGSRAQSIPGPGEMPQSFETSEDLLARTEWNNLQVRMTRPQRVALSTVLSVEKLYVADSNLNLKTGDQLLFEFGSTFATRTVLKTEGQFIDKRTEIQLQPLPDGTAACIAALSAFLIKAKPIVDASGEGGDQRFYDRGVEILSEIRMGMLTSPASWITSMHTAADVPLSDALQTLVDALETEINDILKNPSGSGPGVITDPDEFVEPLLAPAVLQARSSQQLTRNLGFAFTRGSDASPQLLVNLAPRLKETYYKAWANANVNPATSPLTAVYILRIVAPLFGATVSKMPTYDSDNRLNKPIDWEEWPVENDEEKDELFFDQAYEAVLPGSMILVQKKEPFNGTTRAAFRVNAAEIKPRTAYGISGKTTHLKLSGEWWDANNTTTEMATLRGTLVFAQSEKLDLVEEPIVTDVDSQEIELANLYNELKSGRWIILRGERADIPGVSGVNASELMMISGLRHDYDPNLPGDKTHTTLVMATKPAHVYKRETVKILGNVVKATHGETRNETLGSGDGSQAFQTFVLKQPPLTFTPAPTAKGVDSTLKVYVNDVEWPETGTLAGTRPTDRIFVTKTDNESRTSVIFGNGREGARLPSGVENVKAIYRNGIGKPGNVQPEQISLLLSKPLGVKSVINPLRASGGADREDIDLARENAPLALMALDRLVSLQDYADFTRTFAGIGKADARKLSDGYRELIHLTIAGTDDIPIDPISDLYANLLAALRSLGSQDQTIIVDSRELITLVLSARIRLINGYLWDPVFTAIRKKILDTFGFQKRHLIQPALLCEVISAIQNTPGVLYVDVDAFGGIPEKKSIPAGEGGPAKVRLLTLDEISAAVQRIVYGESSEKTHSLNGSAHGPSQRVDALPARIEFGMLRPAQMAIFTPSVPDTIVLNQIV